MDHRRGKTYFIAEIGINHNGNVATAKQLIDVAARAGCDAVKFQKRTLDRVYSADELDRERVSPFGSTNRELKRGLELDLGQLGKLFDYARSVDLDATASVWDEVSVDEVASLNPPFLKIPSPMLRHSGILRACGATGLPVILSTGGASLTEVRSAVTTLGGAPTLLHCVSAYPCPDEYVNLSQMQTLRSVFGGRVGYSSHELGPHAVWTATALGADVLERHITLNRSSWGSDHSMSTEPDELVALVAGVRAVERVLGDPNVVRLPIEEAAVAKLGRTDDYPEAGDASRSSA